MQPLPIPVDKSKDLEKWLVYPEMLPNERFGGFANREDQTQVRGSFVLGQNITLGGSSLPSLRKGYEVIGTENVDATPVYKAHVFETRGGDQFELKIYGTSLYYWLVGTSTEYALLKSSLTAASEWTFNNIGSTNDPTTHCTFSNGTDGAYKFNGAHTTFDSASNAAGAIGGITYNKTGTITVLNGTPTAGGVGYRLNDILTIASGDYLAHVQVLAVSAVGTVTSVSLKDAGTQYTTGAGKATSGGNGFGCTVNITTIATTGGSGYAVNDTITVSTGGANATYTVSAVDPSGGVTALAATNPGSGYSTGTGVATTTSGGGSGLAVDITTVGTGWIKKQGTTSWQDEGFYSTGTNTINIGGAESTYTGAGDTVFLVGVSPDPTLAGTAAGAIIIQSPTLVPTLAQVQGSVGIAHDGRLHFRRSSKKSIWDYSRLDNPFEFTTGSSDGDAGSKDIEYGGPITAFGKLNQRVLAFKKKQIKTLEFVQVGSRIDSPQWKSLVPADDKGTSLGATNQKSTFATPLGMVFVTPDKRLALLTGITANNEPQYVFLSDPIQPVFAQGVFDDAVGICVDNVIYLAFKQGSDSTFNDTVLRGDMTRQSIDTMGRVLPIRWDTPYIGWNVKDWTVIYNSTTGANEIHWHSSLNSNSYRLIDQKSDNTSGYTGIIRTWAEHFDAPTNQKRMEECFVEIRMNDNATVLATLLYDEDGFTGRVETQLTGANAVYKYGGTVYNPYGATAFGTEKIGSNMETQNNPVYRFHIEINPNIYFYNISLQLSTDGAGQDFELVRFGYKLTEIVKDTDRKLLINPST